MKPSRRSALHRVREGLVRQRTAATNQIHAFLLEFGISLPKGPGASSACRRYWPCTPIYPCVGRGA
jgi:transposase